jgi:hypothetical protein
MDPSTIAMASTVPDREMISRMEPVVGVAPQVQFEKAVLVSDFFRLLHMQDDVIKNAHVTVGNTTAFTELFNKLNTAKTIDVPTILATIMMFVERISDDAVRVLTMFRHSETTRSIVGEFINAYVSRSSTKFNFLVSSVYEEIDEKTKRYPASASRFDSYEIEKMHRTHTDHVREVQHFTLMLEVVHRMQLRGLVQNSAFAEIFDLLFSKIAKTDGYVRSSIYNAFKFKSRKDIPDSVCFDTIVKHFLMSGPVIPTSNQYTVIMGATDDFDLFSRLGPMLDDPVANKKLLNKFWSSYACCRAERRIGLQRKQRVTYILTHKTLTNPQSVMFDVLNWFATSASSVTAVRCMQSMWKEIRPFTNFLDIVCEHPSLFNMVDVFRRFLPHTIRDRRFWQFKYQDEPGFGAESELFRIVDLVTNVADLRTMHAAAVASHREQLAQYIARRGLF